MEAQNRRLPYWFDRVSSAQIALPRFQRMEAWSPNRIAGLLTTVLRGLPAGAALILQVGDTMPFVSRNISGAPVTGESTNELLLDGQQRLTALWKALTDGYPDRTYFASFLESDEEDAAGPSVEVINVKFRTGSAGQILPQWITNPAECWSRGYIPMRLLRPGDLGAEVNDWVEQVVGDDLQEFKKMQSKILGLRSCVNEFNLPYLALPPDTPKDVALDVFIKMNTSAVVLSAYDIIVAQAEAATGESIHDRIQALERDVPEAKAYREISDLILDTAALAQDRNPNNAGYLALDLEQMVREWDSLVSGIKGMAQFLAEERVFDRSRLPTVAVLPVLASLWPLLPTAPDSLGEARRVLRKYLWRSSFTDRYESAAASKALNDRRALLAYLQDRAPESAVPVFDETNYPMPMPTQLASAKWPKNVGIVARGVLAMTLRCGARDIADGVPISREHLAEREYHHLYPASLLRAAGLSEADAFLALNCALITWRTNRTISNKRPVEYLRERVEGTVLGDDEIAARLRTHLVPYAELAAAEAGDDIVGPYERFIETRSHIVHRALRRVWDGAEIDDLGPLFEAGDDDLASSVAPEGIAHPAAQSVAARPAMPTPLSPPTADAPPAMTPPVALSAATAAPIDEEFTLRLDRATSKWEASGARELGYPIPDSPYPIEGRIAEGLYLGPDGVGGWVLVRSGDVVGVFETLIAAREVYRTL